MYVVASNRIRERIDNAPYLVIRVHATLPIFPRLLFFRRKRIRVKNTARRDRRLYTMRTTVYRWPIGVAFSSHPRNRTMHSVYYYYNFIFLKRINPFFGKRKSWKKEYNDKQIIEGKKNREQKTIPFARI